MTKVQTDEARTGVEEIQSIVRKIKEAMAKDHHRSDGDYDFGSSVLSLVSRVAIDLHRGSQAAVEVAAQLKRIGDLYEEQNRAMEEALRDVIGHDGSDDNAGAVEPSKGN